MTFADVQPGRRIRAGHILELQDMVGGFQDQLDAIPEAEDLVDMQADIDGLKDGTVPVPLAGIADALGVYATDRARIFNVTEYASAAQLSTDATPAVLAAHAALVAAGGGTILFGPADYAINTACFLSHTVPLLIDLNGQTVTRNQGVNWTVQAPSASLTLSVGVSRGDQSVTLVSASSVATGDLIWLYENVSTETSFNTVRRQVFCVQSVSGSVVTFTSTIRMPFSTSASVTHYSTPQPFTLRNGIIAYNNAPADQFTPSLLRLQGLRGPRVDGVTVYSDQAWKSGGPDGMGIRMTFCEAARYTSFHCEGVSYGIDVETCSNTIIQGVTGTNVRHPVAVAGWSVGTQIQGLSTSQVWQTIESHSAFDTSYANVFAARDESWPNLRCVGGSIFDAKIYSDATNSDWGPYFHSLILADLSWYDQAVLTLRDVELIAPNVTTRRTLGATYGNVVLDNVIATMGDRSDLPQFAATLTSIKVNNCRNPDGTPWDRKAFSQKVRTSNSINLPAYLDTGVYHIDGYKTALDADAGVFRAYGGIVEASTTDPLAISLRIHTNVFPLATASYPPQIMGVLRLRATVRHSNAGSFDILTKAFHFYHKVVATSLVAWPTTAAYTDGLTGQASESLALTISSPTQAGATELGASYPDSWVQADVSVSSSRTSPVYSLTYELELIRS